jgi:hypothetical protein
LQKRRNVTSRIGTSGDSTCSSARICTIARSNELLGRAREGSVYEAGLHTYQLD